MGEQGFDRNCRSQRALRRRARAEPRSFFRQSSACGILAAVLGSAFVGCASHPRSDGSMAQPFRSKDAHASSSIPLDHPATQLSLAGYEETSVPASTELEASGPVVQAAPRVLMEQPLMPMRLEDFESLALSRNPSIQQLIATTQKSAGFRTQVGLLPNPTVGYQAVQLADEGTDQHTVFIEQEIVTGKKLRMNEAVLNETLRAQLWDLEAQKQRVLTDTRTKFTVVLAAQKRLALVDDFYHVANRGVEIAKLRLDAQEGSRIDLLQATIQLNELQLLQQQTRVALQAAWRELSVVSGIPEADFRGVAGDFSSQSLDNDWTQIANQILAENPQYQAARVRIDRARLNLQRQEVQPKPNWTIQLASGVDNGTDSGMINLEVGAPLAIYNRNQGNIAAAKAEYCRAVADAARMEAAIRARAAEVAGSHQQAAAATKMYAESILPSAQETLDLAEIAYKSGETSFLQVLAARRTFFESQLRYVQSQEELTIAKMRIDGLLLEDSLVESGDDSGDAGLRDLTLSQQ